MCSKSGDVLLMRCADRCRLRIFCRIRALRLKYIAERVQSLQLDALRMLLQEVLHFAYIQLYWAAG